MSMHQSVLTTELVEGLTLSPDAVVVDCTLGEGGHASEILPLLNESGVYIGIDSDHHAIDAAHALDSAKADVRLVVANFREIASVLDKENVSKVDAVIADLGWRSDQFATTGVAGGKGFSFSANEPLRMTYGDPETYTFTAHEIANEWEEESIADIVYGYGEERYARRIARAIVEARSLETITTAEQLAQIVASAVPNNHRQRIHPATKTFQAFRIAVNDELGALKDLLNDSIPRLTTGGRMAIITFHSLEDRIVKQHFKQWADDGVVKKITKKPIIASKDELIENPRSRSAKLRIIEKL